MIKLVFIAAVMANGFITVSLTDTKKCCKNERWVECPNSLCIPMTCKELGFPIECRPEGECCGKPACICKEGYVRNDKGVCIPEKQCPSCGGDPNAESGCAINCGRHCSNYNKGPVPCPDICISNSCDCKKGYVYDDNNKKCVLPENCSCGQNEVVSSCANGGCGKWNCTQIGQPDLCIDPLKCESGCICREGYLRDRNGNCIPEKQCYTNLCSKANEIYDVCPSPCPFRTCGIDDRVIFCAPGGPDCPPATCRCKDGFYRDHKGECVTWDQCPLCSNPNEVYDPCPSPCPPRRCDVDESVIRCAAPPKLGDPECKPACRCIDGYVRNDKGICVMRDECPKCTNAHEVYDPCPETCPPQICESIGKVYLCPKQTKCKQCEGACMCESGYYRNKIGECIAEGDCLKCANPHEYFSCRGASDNVCSLLSNLSTPMTTSPPAICSNNTLELLYQGNDLFTAKFLYEVVKSNPNKNVITSPMSVFIPMGELALYAYGDTYDQLITALNLNSKDEIRCVFPQLYNNLKGQTEVILNLAARIFVNYLYPLSQNFLDDTEYVFESEAENVDFSDPSTAAQRINTWAANETNNHITDIATPDMFDSLTRLVLANAIYFLGNWQNQFNPNNTEDRDFYLADNAKIQLSTMYQQDQFRYAEVPSLDCKVLELPYKEDFSFLIFLPNTNNGVQALVEKLLDPNEFYNSYDNMNTVTVDVYLPKMNITLEIDLADVMKKIGITELFNTNGAGLTGILDKYEPLYVSAAKQKAFILVNEKGTEAAAVNVIVMTTLSAIYPPPKVYEFNADKPFIYYMLHKRNSVFCGVFASAQ